VANLRETAGSFSRLPFMSDIFPASQIDLNANLAVGFKQWFLIIVIAALSFGPIHAEPAPSPNSTPVWISQFLHETGGQAALKAVGTKNSPERRFVEDRSSHLGLRTIKDKNQDPLATSNFAVSAFTRECSEHGGRVDKDSAPNVRHLLARQAQPTKGYGSDVWGYQHRVAICSIDSDRVLGAMAAIIVNRTPYKRKYKGDLAAGLLGSTLSNQTLIVALPAASVESRNAAARLDAERFARETLAVQEDAEVQKARAAQLAEWRSNLKIGDESSCGPVIEVRGPMIQIASGAQTYWKRRDYLYPAGYKLQPSGMDMGCMGS
jgi:hypothetical protein